MTNTCIVRPVALGDETLLQLPSHVCPAGTEAFRVHREGERIVLEPVKGQQLALLLLAAHALHAPDIGLLAEDEPASDADGWS